ncbi:hypothetical protein [Neisseria lactamica]|uniref:hypothetical protein n=1 Tax=Neisseria lactamica TaxID=486 RepID=UPI000E57938C|nr:hypothetical protein [Neisseria lactamica]
MMTKSHGYLSNNLPVKIINDIIYATQLVEDLVLGKIKIVDFLKSYNNFYYWLGFDELPQSEKIKFLNYLNILSIHKEIQDKTVNRVYTDCFDIDKLHSLGRITTNECINGIKKIYQKNKLEFDNILK